jgi:type I restriction enzyme S subunit
MVDSGVPWIGEIPEGWEARRLKTLVQRIDQGVSPQAANVLATSNTWGVLKAGCVNHGVFREREHKQLDSTFAINESIRVKVGDVLISRACGSANLVGSVGRVGELHYDLILSDKIFRPVFFPSMNVDFIVYAMNSHYYRLQVADCISGAEGLANNLPLSSLKAFWMIIPSTNDCENIVSFLNSATLSSSSRIASLEREISFLREYRTRLVADVVTGKLDVRKAAEGLPEIDEVEAANDEEEEELESGEDEADAEA